MKVLLVCPDMPRSVKEGEPFLQSAFPSLGVNYLASILRKSGHQVFVQDILFNYISNSRHPDLNFIRKVEGVLQQIKPEIVGISFLTPSRRESLQTAILVKKIIPETLIVAGGAHATVMYEQLLLNYPEIDIVVIGEGEITFRELVKAFETKTDLRDIKGIAFRIKETSQIIVTPSRPLIGDLDSIPFPDYKQYLQFIPDSKLPTASIVTARGCAYGKCNFCASRVLWPHCRMRSVKNVLDEVEKLIKDAGVENIRIHDDTYTFDKERATEIFKGIKHRKLRAIFDFKSRLDKITPDLLYWYKKAGGRSIFYGLESGSERLRNAMTKFISNEQIEYTVKITKEAGIKVGLFVMFGYPGESIGDIRETFEILEKLNPDRVRCMLTKVYPGTQLYQYAKEKNFISDKYWLDEDNAHRYFTFVNGDEVDEIKGYDLLFRERFNGFELWAEYDEQDIPYYSTKSNKLQLLKKQAKRRLFNYEEVIST